MRSILNCTDNKITVSGEGIEYTINRSAIIISDIKIEPKLIDDLGKKLEYLSRIDTRSKGTVLAFSKNLKNGQLSLRERRIWMAQLMVLYTKF